MNKSRIKAILDNIPRDSFITSEALCQKLSLSKKTILNTIREINDFLKDKGACIETIPSRGLQLSITSPESYEAYLISLGQTQSQLPERPEQRLEYIVKRLIVSNQPISIDDLADELFVSRPTLHNDIKQVRQLLESFDLSLDSRRGQGLEITGSEYQKRRCLSHYVKAPFVDEGDIQKDILGQAIHLQDLVKSVLKEHDFHLSDIGFQNLIVHLLIAIKRVEKGNYAVPSNDILGDMVFSPKVNQLAQDLSQRILETYGVSMPESEHFYICLHLDSKRVLSRYASSGNNIVISDEVNLYLSRMFDLVYDTHLVDFRDNFDLKMNLGLHLIPLLVRLRFGMVLDNPLLQEIKQNMAWSYLMAQTAVTILEKDFQQKVDESEIAYIALHFNLALEQRKQQIKRKNVVIVCGSGIGSAELLKYRFMDRFGAYIQEIQTTDVFQLNQLDLSEVDYIISTVPIQDPVEVPILEVGYFFDDKDISNIQKVLENQKVSSLGKYFRADLFFTDIAGQTREEVLKNLVEKIQTVENLPADFYEALMAREALGYTDMVDDIAIPHPLEPMTEKMFVAVGLLKEPVQWHMRQVQMVMLLSLQKGHSDELQPFYQIVSQYLVSPKEIRATLEKGSFDFFMEQLNRIEQKQEKGSDS